MHSTVTLVLGLSKNSIWVFWLLVVISAFHTVVLQVRLMLSYHVLFCTFAFCHTLLSTTILYHCLGTNKISGDQFRKCDSHSSCVQVVPRANVCVCSPQELQEEDQVSHRSSTSRLSRSPLKKVKIMQCKVTLLDGSDYTLDVEVRGRSSRLMATRENFATWRHEQLQD